MNRRKLLLALAAALIPAGTLAAHPFLPRRAAPLSWTQVFDELDVPREFTASKKIAAGLKFAQWIAADISGQPRPSIESAFDDPADDEDSEFFRQAVLAAVEKVGGDDADKWISLLFVIAVHFAPELLETIDGA
jgi:hypothetical protein